MDRVGLDEVQVKRIGGGLAVAGDQATWRSAFMPMFSTVPGPPQSGFSGDGRTDTSGASPEQRDQRAVSGI